MSDHHPQLRPNPQPADPLCGQCGGLCWIDEATTICRDCGGAGRLARPTETSRPVIGGRGSDTRSTKEVAAECAGRTIPSVAKLRAYDLLNTETKVAERQLFALVDAVACVLAHGGHYGSEETARLALESVVGSAVALAAVRALLDDRQPRWIG